MTSSFKRSALLRFEALNDIICTEDTIKLTVLSFGHSHLTASNDFLQRTIHSNGTLQKYLAGDGANEERDTMIIVQQDYSWGRLQITKAALQDLAHRFDIFTGFWDVVNTYGVRTHQDQRAFYGWRSRADHTDEKGTVHEHCYNVPSMEKHGRDLADPWSLRQTGVYRQFHSNKHASRWIMLNLRDNARSDLEHVLKTKANCCRLSTHIELLLILEVNWVDYVEYLSLEVRGLDNKACYTTIERAGNNDGFTVSYKDLQDTHMLQDKIERAKTTISSCIDIGTGCYCSFTSQTEQLESLSLACPRCLSLLRDYRDAMNERLELVQRLDCRLHDILNLLSRILVCRNEVLLTESNQASGSSLDALHSITSKSEKQQSSLAQILSVVQAESVLLKALSIVATVCLPASLIGVSVLFFIVRILKGLKLTIKSTTTQTVFSSNLIQTVPDSENSEPTRMTLAPQFWIFVVLSLPTMFATLLMVLYMDRCAYNKIAAVAEEAGYPLPPRPRSWGRSSKSSSRSSKSKISV